ncbi:MAG: carboxylating nicotinate-nucleotide diphosphorylase, partial [Deltaproteobacteria bacterium]
TRKTVPGWRILDKYAVRIGGGHNHRFGLFDGVLIKDNHISAAGSVGEAIKLVKGSVPHTLKIEVEVETLDELKEAIDSGADAVLLDNMDMNMLRKAVEIAKDRVIIEVSGGITLEDVGEIAKTGVDFISVGAITHSVKGVDISLELQRKGH